MSATPASESGLRSKDDDFSPRIVPAFDGFRGIAALAILVFHCWGAAGLPGFFGFGPLGALFGGTNLGVDMFFVISGFVLFLPMVRTESVGSVRAYAVRRVGRIVPAYYVCIVVVLLLWNDLTFPGGFDRTNPIHLGGGILAIASHLTFTQAIVIGAFPRLVGYNHIYGLTTLATTWSLTIEACFYVALPMVAARFLRRPGACLIGAIVFAVSWRFAMMHAVDLAHSAGWHPGRAVLLNFRHQLLILIPGFAGHFALGMALAWFVVRARQAPHVVAWLRMPTHALAALGASALMVLITWWAWGHEIFASLTALNPAKAESNVYVAVFGELLFAGAFTLFAAVVVLGPRWSEWPWSTPTFRWFGDISYGVFLWQFPALFFLVITVGIRADGPRMTFVVLLLSAGAVSVGLGWLSRTVIENPAMTYARRISRRLDAAHARRSKLPDPAAAAGR